MSDPALTPVEPHSATPTPPGERVVLAARNAVAAIFFLNGLTAATWVSRIPAARAQLHLSPGSLGLLLLAPAIGSLLALPLAGHVVLRLGPRLTCVLFALTCSLGVVVAGVGVGVTVAPLTGVGLFGFGLGTAVVDVGMNVEAAAVEKLMGRSVMPRFHAGWSVGGVLGAGVGAGASALGVAVVLHLVLVPTLAAVASVWASRRFLPSGALDQHIDASAEPRSALHAWTEPRTLLVGAVIFAAALTEGIANDWLGISVVDGYHQRLWVGSLAYGAFVVTMTVGRTFGTGVIDRLGRVVTLRAAAAVSAAGVLLVVVGPVVPVAFAGALLWGLGAALGFPLGMSAAADDPAHAAARVGVAASIGYVGFLAGPPVVGFIGDAVGVRRAVAAVFVALVVIVVLAPAARPLDLARTGGGASPNGSGDTDLTS